MESILTFVCIIEKLKCYIVPFDPMKLIKFISLSASVLSMNTCTYLKKKKENVIFKHSNNHFLLKALIKSVKPALLHVMHSAQACIV